MNIALTGLTTLALALGLNFHPSNLNANVGANTTANTTADTSANATANTQVGSNINSDTTIRLPANFSLSLF